MKTILTSLFLAVAFAWIAIAADASGKWSGTFTPENSDAGTAYLILKQSGSTLQGSAGPDANAQWPGLEGTIHGNKISLQVKSTEDGTVYKCELVLDGDHLKGEATFTPVNGDPGKAKLDLARVAQ